MAFWSTGEPFRQFRWYMIFGNSDGAETAVPTLTDNIAKTVTEFNSIKLDNNTFLLKKVEKPKVKVGKIQHKYLNHFYNYPGRAEWEDIQVTFAGTADLSNRLENIFLNSGYSAPNSESNRKTISKTNIVKNTGATIQIVQISDEGAALETWSLKNPMFVSVQFGSLDYSSEDGVDIQCTIKYDSASVS